MSFRNTHTPRLSEIPATRRKYQLPKRAGKGGVQEFYLTPELQAEFVHLYPITINRKMMRWFGISFSTSQRFKRELGLEKDMPTIRKAQAKITKSICEENGYYDSLRGKPVSEACREGARRKRASGWNPLDELRKNPQRYRQVLKANGEQRKELCRKERIRVNYGLTRQTHLHIPYDPYGRKKSVFRNLCKKAGYIPGNAYTPNERWIIYYTDTTNRGTRREQHGRELGFKFEKQAN